MTVADRSSRARGRAAWRSAGPALLFLALAAVGRAPDVFHHYRDWDEAAMMAQAWAMTRGEVLYRDVFQIHPPLNVVYFVPFFWTFETGVVPHAVKVANILLVALGATLLFGLVAAWLQDRYVASAAAASFVFMTSDRFPWSQSTHGEFLTILPLVASAYLLFVGAPTNSRAFAVGVLWATAFWTRQVAIVDCLFLLAVLAVARRRQSALLRQRLAVIVAGFFAVSTTILIWLVAQGAVVAALRSLFVTAIVHYVGGAGTRWSAVPFRSLGAELPWFCAAAVLGLAGVSASRRIPARTKALAVVSAAWMLIVLLVLSAAGRFYPHYLLQAVAPLAVAANSPLGALGPRIRQWAARLLLVVLTVAMGVHTLAALQELAVRDWKPQAAREAGKVADFLRINTRPDDRIFLYRVGHLDVFFLAERLSGNGVYMYYDMAVEHMHDEALTRRMELELVRHPPAAIVASRTLQVAYKSSERFFWPFLERHYRHVVSFGEIEIHLRQIEPRASSDG